MTKWKKLTHTILKKKPYWGNHLSLNDETKIRKYLKYQEERERQVEGDQEEFGLF